MEYRHEQVRDTGERYIVENGKVVKRYYAGESNGKIYLRKHAILSVEDPPKAYYPWQVNKTETEAKTLKNSLK